jgi:hypothetical protein
MFAVSYADRYNGGFSELQEYETEDEAIEHIRDGIMKSTEFIDFKLWERKPVSITIEI